MTIISDLLEYLHQNFGITHTVQFLVITSLIVGGTIGSLGMFLFVAFLSTRIKRDNWFPKKDRITTLNFEIDGKRFIKAPHPDDIKEAIDILLSATRWILFKRRALHYKSPLKNRLVFYSVTGITALLTLTSFVSTSDAFVTQVHHQVIHRIQLAKRKQQGKNTYAVNKPVTSTVHLQQENTLKKQNKLVSKQFAAGKHENLPEKSPQIETADNKKEKKKAEHNQGGNHRAKQVKVDGKPVMTSDDPDKIAGAVRHAVSHGANNVTVQAYSLEGTLEGTMAGVIKGTKGTLEGTIKGTTGTLEGTKGTKGTKGTLEGTKGTLEGTIKGTLEEIINGATGTLKGVLHPILK